MHNHVPQSSGLGSIVSFGTLQQNGVYELSTSCTLVRIFDAIPSRAKART